MEITAGLRDLLIETAESLSGAERRRFMANTLNKLQLGQRQAACLFGWGRAPAVEPGEREAQQLLQGAALMISRDLLVQMPPDVDNWAG